MVVATGRFELVRTCCLDYERRCYEEPHRFVVGPEGFEPPAKGL
jgi:hypothetical protein